MSDPTCAVCDAGDPAFDDLCLSCAEEIMFSGRAELPCGCTVEPDGDCPCGNVSPLKTAGLI